MLNVAPPGADNIPLVVGSITLCVAASAALSARETYRVHMNDLGNADAAPVAKLEYDQMRAQSVARARDEKLAA